MVVLDSHIAGIPQLVIVLLEFVHLHLVLMEDLIDGHIDLLRYLLVVTVGLAV